MIEALHVTWQSLKAFWEDFVFLVILNIIWSLAIVAMIAPQFLLFDSNPILALILSLLLSWPVPIVSSGLCFVTNQIAREQVVDWQTFFLGMRRYWAKSLAVALINLAVLITFVVNLQFYALIVQGAWTSIVVVIWIILGLYWLLAQVYWFPMILELESEKVLLALRSALSLVLISPGFTLVLGALVALLTVLCILLTIPVVLIMASLLLLIANHAIRNRLAFVQKKREKWDQDEAE
jgi:hypothetical protein